MIQRSNELVYTRRFYLLPFKPMMDYEYKKFGYKKCDVNVQKGDFFHTVYYVHHKERPEGTVYRLLCGVNRILSTYRVIFAPIAILVLFLLGLVVSVFGNNQIFAEAILVLALLLIPSVILSAIFSNLAYRILRREDMDGKTDRALTSHGWTPWTSYKDNDSRFQPPVTAKKNANPTPAAQTSTKKTPAPIAPNTDMDDNVVIMKTADGSEIAWDVMAIVNNRGKTYAVMTLHEPTEDIDTDEAFVFEYTDLGGNEAHYQLIGDDTLIDEALAIYDQLLEEAENS